MRAGFWSLPRTPSRKVIGTSETSSGWPMTASAVLLAGAIGRSIRCTCLGDGEETRWNRTDFIGVLKEECLPQWAAEALSKLTEGKEQSHTQGGMTMQ